MDLLKLIALDRDDVEIISTHLQDAVLKVADVRWQPGDKRLVVGVNRFDWEAAHDDRPEYRRRRAVLNLLAVEFVEKDPPGGVVTLVFSGGAALRLEVECLEAELADLGPVWTTAACPDHMREVS
jgi:hypothetical protein